MIWIAGERQKAGRCVVFLAGIARAPDASDGIRRSRRYATSEVSSASNRCDFNIIRANFKIQTRHTRL
jgi:hypothetical protein